MEFCAQGSYNNIWPKTGPMPSSRVVPTPLKTDALKLAWIIADINFAQSASPIPANPPTSTGTKIGGSAMAVAPVAVYKGTKAP